MGPMSPSRRIENSNNKTMNSKENSKRMKTREAVLLGIEKGWTSKETSAQTGVALYLLQKQAVRMKMSFVYVGVGRVPKNVVEGQPVHKVKRPGEHLKVRKKREKPWGTETADPSNLAQWQLDTARRVGIKPERFAWLCTCPNDGNARGWMGGNTIG